MNLQQTIDAMEAKGIAVALDCGVHRYCALESNCPLAVQLRRTITDAGTTLEQVLEGYEEVTVEDPVNLELPEFNATLHLRIAGKEVELDFNEIASSELKTVLEGKLEEAERLEGLAKSLGRSLFQAYLEEIHKCRWGHQLPQLTFSVQSLLEAGCFITAQERKYHLLFPSEYNPQYIVSGSTRYKLSASDVEDIRREIYIKYSITLEGRFLRANVLDKEGVKLQHYHGDSRYDCWGAVVLPTRWGGALLSLTRLTRSLAMSLTTIDYGSILMSLPYGMPLVRDLLGRSTRLGEEGVPDEEEQTATTGRQGWGRAARGGRA